MIIIFVFVEAWGVVVALIVVSLWNMAVFIIMAGM